MSDFIHSNATYHVDIYVDCVNGSDTNSGLAKLAPVKTLKTALDIMNRNADGVYIHLISPGEYTLSYPVISGAMIHFLYEASNITMYWLDTKDKGWSKCFYNCYINIHGNSDGTSVFYIRGSKLAYLEAGKLTISNITLKSDPNGAFGIVGGAIQSSNNIYKTHLYLGISQGVFASDTFETESQYAVSAIHAYNSSTLTFRSGIKFNNINNNSTIANLLSLTGCTVYFIVAPTFTNTDITKMPVYTNTCQIYGTEKRVKGWLSTCRVNYTTINGTYCSSITNYPIKEETK